MVLEEDLRKIKLKQGLNQLSNSDLIKLLTHINLNKRMICDNFLYSEKDDAY